MIGLEYILQMTGMQQKDIAEKIGINKQNVTHWIKGTREIPKKYLPILAEMFGLQESYFQLELRETDKLEIQNILMFHKVQGSFVAEMSDDDDDDSPVITVTPKNFDTDPRFAKIYRNNLSIGLRQDIDSLKEMFEFMSSIECDEVQQNQDIKVFCSVIEELTGLLYDIVGGKAVNREGFIKALDQFQETFSVG